MKGRNFLWGTALYAATIIFLYGRRKVTLGDATQAAQPRTLTEEQTFARGLREQYGGTY